MKKLVLGFLSLVLLAGTLQAQSGKKALSKARNAYRTYTLSPKENGDKLQEAIDAIEIATTADDTKASAKSWLTKGDIYKSIWSNFTTMSVIDKDYKREIDNAALLAYESYMKAYEYAVKRDIKTAVTGIGDIQPYLVEEGAAFYQMQDYNLAYSAFRYALDAHDLLLEQGKKTIFEEAASHQDQVYYTALAALNAKKMEEAKPLFINLKDSGYEKPAVYEALYKLELENDRSKALTLLEEARAKFPDDVTLLFSEINHYLADGAMDKLVGKLQTAIQKEPDNISLYTTLGSIYDNLYQKAAENGESGEAKENFANALKNYEMALEKDPKFFDAVYSIGALYYNRAAATTEEMNKLADDYSKEALKKYDELRKVVLTQFDEALPYFKNAEALNPNDRNTLIALKEIFARKDDLPTSNEFKARLENIEAGGTNEASYFKK